VLVQGRASSLEGHGVAHVAGSEPIMARLGLDPRGEGLGLILLMAGGPFALHEPIGRKSPLTFAALWVTHVTSVWLGLLGPTDPDR
jgi:hypothetical protein